MHLLSHHPIKFQAIVPSIYNGILNEALHRLPGEKQHLPARIHHGFTFYLCHQLPFRYQYRRSQMIVPARTLAVFRPEEVYSGEDIAARFLPTVARMLSLPAFILQRATSELIGKPITDVLPLAETVIDDPQISELYLAAHHQIANVTDPLAADTAIFMLLERLIACHTSAALSSLERQQETTRVRRACEYLHEHFACNVSLQELADSVALSPYHFHRIFQQQMGMTPYSYLQNVRVDHARHLLASGLSVGETAQETGFADESHFIRRFRHIVGITPGRYSTSR